MFRLIKPVSLVLCVSALLVACKSESDKSTLEVAAKVGSREITLSQVDHAVRARMNANATGNVTFTPAELANARLTVLDELIRNEALFQRAEKQQGLVPDDNRVTQELQKAKQGLTEEEYKAQLQSQQTTEEEVRQDLRKAIAINDLVEREKAKIKEPKEEEIRKYYETNKAAYVNQRGADVSVIAVSPDHNGGPAGAELKIQSIYTQLKSGSSDFAAVARQKSEEQQTAQQGGRLGFGSEAGIQQLFPSVPNLGSRLMSMNPGQYTEPIKDNLSGAWYIFLLNAKQEQPQNVPYDQAKQTIVQDITTQRQNVLTGSLARVALVEVNVRNYLAERLVSNPEMISNMQPSALLTQPGAPAQQQQPQPRIENENQSPAANSNRPPFNANRAAASNSNKQ